ncbi:MAG: tRNA (adenosine(37)-N6)-threonylcarbamoyltransferase complex ATPase subunit type 1 TsaE [Nitrospirae bacterium]|nr:tRNA (adenosine(37)-N6)-threonylcarbamoyltransferase complex ATPase subunit type 1 TsaE [Nitrospirota bacterium]
MKFNSKSEVETKEIGRNLGKRLKAGDVVCLYGEFGAGKTTMVKGIASAIGINERDITSASFTIISEYKGVTPFYHIDLYRVEPDGVHALGLHEYLGKDGISVIEWAEKAGNEIPDGSIKIHLTYTGENSREIVIEGILLDEDT